MKGGLYAGGIAGSLRGGIIESCDNAGEVEGQSNAGGIAGQVNRGKIHASRHSGKVKALVENAGGIAGYYEGGEIFACYSKGDVESVEYAAGIVGYYVEASKGNITACYNIGKVSCSQPAAIVGCSDSANKGPSYSFGKYIRACYWVDYRNGSTGWFGTYLPTTNDNAKPFGDTNSPPFDPWPGPLVHLYWTTGDGSGTGTWWKDLGKWNGSNNSVFPALYWE